jgi:hypothetical protein
MCPCAGGKLHRDASHSAGRSDDEHATSDDGAEAGQRLQRGDAGDREGALAAPRSTELGTTASSAE